MQSPQLTPNDEPDSAPTTTTTKGRSRRVLAGVAAVVVLTRSRWRGLSGARLTVTLMLLMTVLFLAIVGVATAVYNPQPNTDQRNLLLLPVAAAVVIGIVGPRLFRRAPLQRLRHPRTRRRTPTISPMAMCCGRTTRWRKTPSTPS